MNTFDAVIRPPVLLLVAHWDDETISAGGTLARRVRGWDVVCVTTRLRGKPELGYREACELCGATPVSLGFPHKCDSSLPEKNVLAPITVEVLTSGLRRAAILPESYGTVITHHPQGDVGQHPQHREISQVMAKLVSRDHLFYFSCTPTNLMLTLTCNESKPR